MSLEIPAAAHRHRLGQPGDPDVAGDEVGHARVGAESVAQDPRPERSRPHTQSAITQMGYPADRLVYRRLTRIAVIRALQGRGETVEVSCATETRTRATRP